jgi:hypothetical protein
MRLPVLLIGLLVVAGCSGVVSSPGGSLPIYESADEVPGEFEILADVTPTSAASRSSYGSRDTGVVEARRSASTIGADAIIVVSPDDEGNDALIRDFLSNPAGGNVSAPRAVVQKRYLAIRVVPVREEADGEG